jgi:curved DNA-binding protein CbpA
MTQRVINRYSELSIDEINEPINLKRKAEKKLREIENLKQHTSHTSEELGKLAREQEWRNILNPTPPIHSNEPKKRTSQQVKKEKEREAKRKRAEELRQKREAQQQREKEAQEKRQREYEKRQEEFRRARKEQEERDRKEKEEHKRMEEETRKKRDTALGNKFMNDRLAIKLYEVFNNPLAIHLYTEYGNIQTKSDNRTAYIRLSRKYHPDKTGGTTTEHQKIIVFIRDYLDEVL